MTYNEALIWLYALSGRGVHLTQGRVADVLARLGHPQNRFSALHIAGTNGKGSTSAMAASLLRQTGRYRVGLYTSPHLLRVTERWQISTAGSAFVECPKDEFVAALTVVQEAASRPTLVPLTFFEVLTAAAFVWFAERRVDLAVVETGLGGRLDATGLCRPLATAVTSIGFDHMEILGDTLPKIAYEKAGIFRPSIPTAVSCPDPDALAVLRSEAKRVGAPFFHVGQVGVEMPTCPLALLGAHQRTNAALAIFLVQAALRSLGDLGPLEALSQSILHNGLANAKWPGRLEPVWRDVPSGREVWVDAAHNQEGAVILSHWLEEQPKRPLTVVFGVVQGKDAAQMCGPLLSADHVILTSPRTPRACPVEALLSVVSSTREQAKAGGLLTVEPDPEKALALALERTPIGGLVLVYGSIFLVSAVRQIFTREEGDPLFVQDPAVPKERNDPV